MDNIITGHLLTPDDRFGAFPPVVTWGSGFRKNLSKYKDISSISNFIARIQTMVLGFESLVYETEEQIPELMVTSATVQNKRVTA